MDEELLQGSAQQHNHAHSTRILSISERRTLFRSFGSLRGSPSIPLPRSGTVSGSGFSLCVSASGAGPYHVAMPTDIKLLEKQKSSVKADASHLAGLLKKARARQCYEMRREEERTARRRRVGLAILASRPEGTAVLKEFLRTELVSEQEERVDKECADIVEVFLQMDPNAIVGLTEPIAAEAQSDLQVAIDFAVKWELREWTSLQNRNKGVAPSVASLLDRKRKLTCDLRGSVGMPPTTETGRRARYKWVQTWRRSWKMPKGCFKHVDMPSVADMRRKVRTWPWSARCQLPRLPSSSDFPVSSTDPRNKKVRRHSLQNRVRKLVRIWGAVSTSVVRPLDRFPAPIF